MKVQHLTPILNVSDIAASLAWFESLGWQRSFTWNSGGGIPRAASQNEHGPAEFAGICNGKAEIFLCCGAQGHRPGPGAEPAAALTSGVWMSWWLETPADVDRLFELATRLGYRTPMTPVDEPWNVREFHLRHPDGHTIRVSAGTDHTVS